MIARTGMGIGIRMGQKERDSQNRTGRTGQAKRDMQNRTARHRVTGRT